MKFEVTGFYTLEVTAPTDPHLKIYKGNNSKYTEDRVMVLMYCCALLLNVSYQLKPLNLILWKLWPRQGFRDARKDGQTR